VINSIQSENKDRILLVSGQIEGNSLFLMAGPDGVIGESSGYRLCC
jgi:hypothetical protein